MTVETVATADDVREALAGKPAKVKKEKKIREPKVKAEETSTVSTRAEPLPADLVLHYGNTKDGNVISLTNMPMHEGTKRHARFLRFNDGMTVADAAAVDLPNNQIRQYIQRGWVVAEGYSAAPTTTPVGGDSSDPAPDMQEDDAA